MRPVFSFCRKERREEYNGGGEGEVMGAFFVWGGEAGAAVEVVAVVFKLFAIKGAPLCRGILTLGKSRLYLNRHSRGHKLW